MPQRIYPCRADPHKVYHIALLDSSTQRGYLFSPSCETSLSKRLWLVGGNEHG